MLKYLGFFLERKKPKDNKMLRNNSGYVCVFPNVDHKWHLFSLFGPQVYRTGLTAILGS